MVFDSTSAIAYALGLVIIFILCRVFAKPLKWVLKLLLNGVIGGLILAAVNFVGGFAGINIIINPFSSLLAGLLGVPGVILVVLLQYIL